MKVLARVKPAKVLAAVNTARAAARTHAGQDSPLHGAIAENPLVIDIDVSLRNSNSEKEDARPTWKNGFAFHQLCSMVDHGILGTGEPLVTLLRPGNAGSNTAADQIQVVKDSIKQLPEGYRARADNHDPHRLRRHVRLPGPAHRHGQQLLLLRRVPDQRRHR
ncbi:transposase [Arthrobacter dokdonensis]|uniref:transposase n=1 Tax=Arthrobacter dokdonellae TaxID=2211210 RepID=UPI001494002C|nr:transposase [Arthrobacter dokdonellae]